MGYANRKNIADIEAELADHSVEEKQNQQSSHWQVHLAGSGIAKAEATGKIVVVTDILFLCTASAAMTLKQGGAAGTTILTLRCISFDTITHAFRQGPEGAAYDGSGAGNIYYTLVAGTNVLCTITGYMRDV